MALLNDVPGDNMVPGDHGAEHQDDQPSPGERCCPGPIDEDRSEIPYTDAWTTALVDHAVDELATVRCPSGAGDPAARLSCLVSLAAEAGASIIEAVAAAHEAGHSWDDIAMRTAETTDDVVERFGPYTAWRAAGMPLPVRPATSEHHGPAAASHNGSVTAPCLVCGGPLPPGRQDRTTCTDRCRQEAFRRRRQGAGEPEVPLPPKGARRAVTVYECDQCGARALGDQYCSDCRTFTRSVGTGGLCLECQAPVALSDLMGGGHWA
jgi:hypothetical protein